MHNEPFHVPIHLDCSNFQHNSNPEKNLYYETKKDLYVPEGRNSYARLGKARIVTFFSRRRLVVLSKCREEIKTLINQPLRFQMFHRFFGNYIFQPGLLQSKWIALVVFSSHILKIDKYFNLNSYDSMEKHVYSLYNLT